MENRTSLGVILTGGVAEEATSWAGAALLAELYRKAGIKAAAERALPKKKSSKGLRQGQMVESFVLLSSRGGDCIEDMERLRQNEGWRRCLVTVHRHLRRQGDGDIEQERAEEVGGVKPGREGQDDWQGSEVLDLSLRHIRTLLEI
jgi:hypothetical protein